VSSSTDTDLDRSQLALPTCEPPVIRQNTSAHDRRRTQSSTTPFESFQGRYTAPRGESFGGRDRGVGNAVQIGNDQEIFIWRIDGRSVRRSLIFEGASIPAISNACRRPVQVSLDAGPRANPLLMRCFHLLSSLPVRFAGFSLMAPPLSPCATHNWVSLNLYTPTLFISMNLYRGIGYFQNRRVDRDLPNSQEISLRRTRFHRCLRLLFDFLMGRAGMLPAAFVARQI
jgi:hypothetical protein